MLLVGGPTLSCCLLVGMILIVPNAAFHLHTDALLFRVMVQMHLCFAMTAADGLCLLCDGVADRFDTPDTALARGIAPSNITVCGLSWPVALKLLPGWTPEIGVSNPAGRRPVDI